MTLEEAAAGKGVEAVKAAASAASTATKGYAEGVVPKVPTIPGVMEQIMGGDDIVLTVMATITLLLGVIVTGAAVYVTVTNWQVRTRAPPHYILLRVRHARGWRRGRGRRRRHH